MELLMILSKNTYTFLTCFFFKVATVETNIFDSPVTDVIEGHYGL